MSTITIEVKIDPEELPEQTRKDLQANAQLKRTSPEQLMADILAKKLGGLFKVRPQSA